MLEIHLNSGNVLTLTQEQSDALDEYLEMPNNQVPEYDPKTDSVNYKKRWENQDIWIEFHFNQLLAGVFAASPPVNVDTVQGQIDKLNEYKRQVLMPVKK